MHGWLARTLPRLVATIFCACWAGSALPRRAAADVNAAPAAAQPNARLSSRALRVATGGSMTTSNNVTLGNTIITDPGMVGTPTVIDTTCQPAFDPYCACPCPCPTGDVWGQGPGIFAEFLYLNPRDLAVPFALPQDSLGLPGSVPVGPVANADVGYSPGFRVGALWGFGDQAISLAYAWLDSDGDNQATTTGTDVINPLVMFPGTFNAGFLAQEATSNYRIQYQFANLDYHMVADSSCRHWYGVLVGAAYATLDQDLSVTYPFAPPDGTTTVTTAVYFEGGGPRLGLEGERQIISSWGIWVYGRGVLTLLVGEFRSSYQQENQFNGVEVNTSWNSSRIVPVVDLEAGLSWTSPQGLVRISAGYLVSAWFNSVTTADWVQSVQQTNFTDVSNQITFDGLVARAEVRF
jgi:hypothetical protein